MATGSGARAMAIRQVALSCYTAMALAHALYGHVALAHALGYGYDTGTRATGQPTALAHALTHRKAMALAHAL